MAEALRVVVVTHTADLGGAELALLRLCAAVDRSAFHVEVVCLEDGDLTDGLRDLGVGVHVLPPTGRWVSGARRSTGDVGGALTMAAGGARQAAGLSRLLRRLAPDVVQSWTLKSHLVTTLALPAVRRPLVWYLHDRVSEDYLGRLNSAVVAALSRASAAILANSGATAATLARTSVVAYPGLAPEQFRDPAARGGVVARADLLMLGRIARTKGQREVLLAMPEILASCPSARLTVVGAPLFGEEEYAAECRAMVSRLGLQDAVSFVGPSARPTRDLDDATLLVHASPVPEPFGQVVAEAMARGVPVVATDAGGVKELLQDDGGDVGLLVPPGDPSALARAVLEVLHDPAGARRRATAAYERARARFTIEQTASTVQAVWSQVGRPGLTGAERRRRAPGPSRPG